MFKIILYEPEIPANTGNIIRLCANTQASLHLVEPLGFTMEDRLLRRAGLDYHECASISVHKNWDACQAQLSKGRLFAFSTKGSQRYDLCSFSAGDRFLFGPETRGLPTHILKSVPESQCIRVPMAKGSRSLNLSNTVAIVLYEAMRQLDFGSCQ